MQRKVFKKGPFSWWLQIRFVVPLAMFEHLSLQKTLFCSEFFLNLVVDPFWCLFVCGLELDPPWQLDTWDRSLFQGGE